MLTSPPPRFPSDIGTISAATLTHPTANGRPLPIMRQALHSLFARIVDFLRRKNGSATWPSSSPAGRSAMDPIVVIGLLLSYEDRRLLANICSRNRWNLLFADTCEEAQAVLDKLEAPVILYDRDLPGKGWRQTVEGLAWSPYHSCVILVSRVVDSYLRDEVVRMGGYDVLSKPLREDDVIRAVRLASLYWNTATRKAAIPGKRQTEESL